MTTKASITYAASSDLTVTALQSLAHSATLVNGWESNVIDNTTTKYLDILVSCKFTVYGSGLAAGVIGIWAVPMLDDSTWPGGFDGTESAETAPLTDANGIAGGAKLIGQIVTGTTASQVYDLAAASVAARFGGVCPAKFVIYIAQSTAQALASSGNQVTIKGINFESA